MGRDGEKQRRNFEESTGGKKKRSVWLTSGVGMSSSSSSSSSYAGSMFKFPKLTGQVKSKGKRMGLAKAGPAASLKFITFSPSTGVTTSP